MLQEMAAEIRKIDKEHTKLAQQEHTQKLRTLIDKKQKVGNKLITGQYKGVNSMEKQRQPQSSGRNRSSNML